MRIFEKNNYFSKGTIFFMLFIFICGNYTIFQDLTPITKELKVEYADYFNFKRTHSLVEVYSNYNKLSDIEMISLNVLIEDSIKHSVYYDYKMYIDDYFRLTNKHYDNQYPEKVKSQIDKYINKYKYKQYLILLKNFILYVVAIIGGVLIFDLVLNMLKKLKRKIT